MKKLLMIFAILLGLTVLAEADVLNVVTTTTDLASIAEEVGGEKVVVRSLSRGTQDHHYVEVRPSMVVTVRNADLLILVGMDHDVWVQALIDSARVRELRFGRSGYLDASTNIRKKEVPEGRIDASMGHLHVYGNPHYWLDPENAKIIARDIADRLSELAPEHKDYFQQNLDDFKSRIDEKLIEWKAKMEPFEGEQIAVFHGSWPYFAHRFGLETGAELEPRPGLPPSTSHLRDVVEKVRRNDIKVIVSEVFHSPRPGRFVAEHTDAVSIKVPSSVGGTEGADDYFAMIDIIIDRLTEALER